MPGYNQMNRGYNEQSGIDWGKMALYGAGAALGYGVLRAGAMKLAPQISAGAAKAKKAMNWASAEAGRAVDSVRAKMAKADAPAVSAQVASTGTSVGPMSPPSARPGGPHSRVPFSPPVRAGLSTDPLPAPLQRGSRMQAFALAHPRVAEVMDSAWNKLRGFFSSGAPEEGSMFARGNRLPAGSHIPPSPAPAKPPLPPHLDRARARNKGGRPWMGARAGEHAGYKATESGIRIPNAGRDFSRNVSRGQPNGIPHATAAGPLPLRLRVRSSAG